MITGTQTPEILNQNYFIAMSNFASLSIAVPKYAQCHIASIRDITGN